MKVAQIGCCNDFSGIHNSLIRHGLDICAIAPGNDGIEDESIVNARNSLIIKGFSVKMYADFKSMIKREKPDIALVNTWFNDIGKVALFCLSNGVHALCANPIAHSIDIFSRLSSFINNSSFKAVSLLDFRYMSEFLTAKSALLKGAIGDIRMINSQISHKLEHCPEFYQSRDYFCGILQWLGVRAIDLSMWLTGEKYLQVSAFHSCRPGKMRTELDRFASANFLMTNEIISTVSVDLFLPISSKNPEDIRVKIVGTEGIIDVSNGKVLLISDSVGGEIELPLEPPRDIFADFLEQIKGEENNLTFSSSMMSAYWSLATDVSAVRCGEDPTRSTYY